MAAGENDRTIHHKELPLNGKCVTAVDGVGIGIPNFRKQINLRYADTNPRPIKGQTKINAAGLANRKIRRGHQFLRHGSSESHTIVQAFDVNGANSNLYRLSVVPPTAGEFDSSVFFAETNTANRVGSFSDAPSGMMAYCNGHDTLLYGGNEMLIGAWLELDMDGGTYKYDYSVQMQNSLQDTDNIASIHSTPAGLDTDTKMYLKMDGVEGGVTFADEKGAHPATAFGNARTRLGSKALGTASCYFDGTVDHLEIGDHADFDFSGGTWTVDFWANPSAAGTIYYQGAGGDNFRIEATYSGGLWGITLAIAAAGPDIVSITSGNFYTGWQHVEVNESGDDYRIFINGYLVASVTVAAAERAADYASPVFIGSTAAVGALYTGYLDELRVSNSARHSTAFSPPSSQYGADTYTTILIGSPIPLSGWNHYVLTANAVAGSYEAFEWDDTGTWAPLSNLTLPAAWGGVPFGSTGKGTVTFDNTAATSKVKAVDEVIAYWYRIVITKCATTTKLYQCTLKTEPQQAVDNWDGEYRGIASYLLEKTTFEDYTTNVFADDWDASIASTFAQLGSLTAGTQHVYCGFLTQMMELKVGLIGGAVNSTPLTVLSVDRWSGTAWTTVGKIDDGTANTGISFNKSGTIMWNPPAGDTEHVRSMTSGTKSLGNMFFYRLTFSQTLSGDVKVYYTAGIPVQNKIRGYAFPLHFLNRLWLCGNLDSEPNIVLPSSQDTAQVFNGFDSVAQYIGTDSPLVAGAAITSRYASSIYNMAVFFKTSEVHTMMGKTLQDLVIFRTSALVGCTAAATVKLIPSMEVGQGNTRPVVMFQSANGIYITDGTAVNRISDDIQDIFTPGSATEINRDYADKSHAWYDDTNLEYHWCYCDGANTEPNKEWAYDVKRHRWFEVDRTTGKRLCGNVQVVDFNGTSYVYGFVETTNGGFLHRLEYGDTFDTASMTFTVAFLDLAPYEGRIAWETTCVGVKCIFKANDDFAGASLSVTHYSDTEATGHALPAIPMASVRGSRVVTKGRTVNRDGTFHGIEQSFTSISGSVGLEPLFMILYYKQKRADINISA